MWRVVNGEMKTGECELTSALSSLLLPLNFGALLPRATRTILQSTRLHRRRIASLSLRLKITEEFYRVGCLYTKAFARSIDSPLPCLCPRSTHVTRPISSIRVLSPNGLPEKAKTRISRTSRVHPYVSPAVRRFRLAAIIVSSRKSESASRHSQTDHRRL